LLWFKTRLAVITVFLPLPSTIKLLASANVLISAIVEENIIMSGLIIQFAAVNVLLFFYVLQVSILTLKHALVNAIRSIVFHHLFKIQQVVNVNNAKTPSVNLVKFGAPLHASVSVQRSCPVTSQKFGMRLNAHVKIKTTD
jgi:hypothetical protein